MFERFDAYHHQTHFAQERWVIEAHDDLGDGASHVGGDEREQHAEGRSKPAHARLVVREERRHRATREHAPLSLELFDLGAQPSVGRVELLICGRKPFVDDAESIVDAAKLFVGGVELLARRMMLLRRETQLLVGRVNAARNLGA
jgi:hypothetical protein